jgi:hypothetical protein
VISLRARSRRRSIWMLMLLGMVYPPARDERLSHASIG